MYVDPLHGLDPLCDVTRSLLDLTKARMKLKVFLQRDPEVLPFYRTIPKS